MVICDHWSYVTMKVVLNEPGIWLKKMAKELEGFQGRGLKKRIGLITVYNTQFSDTGRQRAV